MSNKTVLKALIFFIAILVGILVINYPRHEAASMKPDLQLEPFIAKAIKTTQSVDFSTLTRFEWDTLYVVTPYANPKEILEEHGVTYQQLDSPIETLDDINLLVFTYKGKIVCYANIKRQIADFDSIRGDQFTKDKTKFTATLKDNWVTLKHED